MTNSCKGDGDCLVQIENGYELNQWVHNCLPIKCPNFIMCNSEEPSWCMPNARYFVWHMERMKRYIANHRWFCCLENKLGISQPNIATILCIDCVIMGSNLHIQNYKMKMTK